MKEIERLPSCTRTTMSVPEMGKLLGIKKVESYWFREEIGPWIKDWIRSESFWRR